MANEWGTPITDAIVNAYGIKMRKQAMEQQQKQFEMQQDAYELDKAMTSIKTLSSLGYKFHKMNPQQLGLLFEPLERITGQEWAPRDESGNIVPPKPGFDDLMNDMLVGDDDTLTSPQLPSTSSIPPTEEGTPAGALLTAGKAKPRKATVNEQSMMYPGGRVVGPVGGMTNPPNAQQSTTPSRPTKEQGGINLPGGMTLNELRESVIRHRLGMPSKFEEQKALWDQYWNAKNYEAKVRGQDIQLQGMKWLNDYRQLMAKVIYGDKKARLDWQKTMGGLSEKAKIELNRGMQIQSWYEKVNMNPEKFKTPQDLLPINEMLIPYNCQFIIPGRKTIDIAGGKIPLSGQQKPKLVPLDPNKPMKPFISIPKEMENLTKMIQEGPKVPTELEGLFTPEEMQDIMGFIQQEE